MDYEIIKIRTVMNKDAGNSGLSFIEGEHDIPFDIKRMYFVYKEPINIKKIMNCILDFWKKKETMKSWRP